MVNIRKNKKKKGKINKKKIKENSNHSLNILKGSTGLML